MFIRQDGKIFIQDGDKIVGVEIYPDKIVKLKDTKTNLLTEHEIFTANEIKRKYNISEDNPYIFPKEVVEKGVEAIEPTTETKKPAKKPRGK